MLYHLQVLSSSTSAAINTLIDTEDLPLESTTTAWFCQYIDHWFDIMNARHFDAALFPGQYRFYLKSCLFKLGNT